MKKYFWNVLFIVAISSHLAFAIAPDISAGGRHVLALKDNGEVWAWGDNQEGQLGQASLQGSSFKPIKVPLPPGRTGIAVAGGDRHSLILLDDQTVLSLGANSQGQLGIGEKYKKLSVMNGLTNVKAIAAGGQHSMVLKNDGTVWTFGSNICGQLGDGTLQERTGPLKVKGPIKVLGIEKIKAIAAGLDSSYALTQDGRVFAWGEDITKRADAKGSYRTHPVPVQGLRDIIAIAAGWRHAVALKRDGTVWFWGKRWNGIFGIKDTQDFVSQPEQIVGIGDAVRIAAGSEHTVIVRSDGSMWAFGSNTKGQLGNEAAWPGSVIFAPQASVLKSDVEKITAGIDTTYALKKDGTISAFGAFESGQMGDGTTNHATAVQVDKETQADKVSGGVSHTVIRRANGNVGWMGFYNTEKFSRGGKSPYDQDYRLQILTRIGNIKQIASGDEHTLLLKTDGTVWAYGKGDKGQLGNGRKESSMVPVQVIGLTNVTAIAAGGDSSLAICENGRVMTWGSNEFGQLGDGTTENQSIPVRIAGDPTQITGAAMGKNHALLCKENGTVWIWGNTEGRQIMDNRDTFTKKPQQVPQLANVKSVAAGEGFSLALLKNQTVVAWGANYLGQLGLGNQVATTVPTAIPGLTRVAQIAAGTWHGLARLEDGTLKAWGLNDCGQLGDGTFSNQNSPVTVKDLAGITDITAGEKHSCAVRNDHTAWSWGSNEHEQLGVSATKEHRSAIRLKSENALELLTK